MPSVNKLRFITITLLVFVGLTGWDQAMSKTPEPAYQVLQAQEPIEIRAYEPMIIAEVNVTGKRQEAIQTGFRLLSDYIFGNNLPRQKLTMAAPVTQQSGEEIAMIAPVTQQADKNNWKVHFVMPAGYTLDTLPTPKNPQVKLIAIPATKMAVIRFSGLGTDNSIQKNLTRLQTYLEQQHLKTTGEPILAFYNPPWILPFLRHNEIMLKLAE